MPPKGRTKDVSQPKTIKPEIPLPALEWPPLRPLVPRSDLSLDILLTNQIAVIKTLFTSTLSKSLVSFLSKLDLITTPAKPRSGEAVRVNDRLEVKDNAFAQTLWQTSALEDLIRQSVTSGEASWGGEVVGLNPRIRIYRYKEGQFFAPHCRFQGFFPYQYVSVREEALSKDISYACEPTSCPSKTGPVKVSGFRTLSSVPSIRVPVL